MYVLILIRSLVEKKCFEWKKNVLHHKSKLIILTNGYCTNSEEKPEMNTVFFEKFNQYLFVFSNSNKPPIWTPAKRKPRWVEAICVCFFLKITFMYNFRNGRSKNQTINILFIHIRSIQWTVWDRERESKKVNRMNREARNCIAKCKLEIFYSWIVSETSRSPSLWAL